MTLIAVTLRWDPDSWEMISRAARRRGVSASEFVRTAACARAAFTYAADEPEIVDDWMRLYDGASEMIDALVRLARTK